MRKPGRPLEGDEPRTHVRRIRLSPGELAVLDEHGLEPATALRIFTAVLQRARKKDLPKSA
jgi:hypothetical protein